MSDTLSADDRGKLAAALAAVDLVADGMRLGLGTGSTAAWMVRALAARAKRENLKLVCAATSDRTAAQAIALGLTVTDIDTAGPLDLTIDGADEVDPAFRLIKGGGGAHLREKIVAAASARMVVITDPRKDVARLGAFPLPVEITPFGHACTLGHIQAALREADVAGRAAALRMGAGAPLRTDEGNLIADLSLGSIGDPEALDAALAAIPGVIETGLFIGLCDTVIVGHPDGRAVTRRPGHAPETRQTDPAAAATLP